MGHAAAGTTAGLPAWIRQTADGHELALHVRPGARRQGVVGVHGDRLKVAVTMPPVDGRANEAVLALVAERLDLPLRAVRLVAGSAARDKRVVVAAPMGAEELVRRLSTG